MKQAQAQPSAADPTGIVDNVDVDDNVNFLLTVMI